MAGLTRDMQRIVSEQKLGFIATVNADGTPNVSPKATFVVLDERRIAFGDLRSPNTVRNIAQRPGMELNMVDPFARRGFRARGTATYLARGTSEFDALQPHFEAWGALAEALRGIVVMTVEQAAPVTSPAYDRGATEAELRAQWEAHFRDVNASAGAPAD